MLIHYITNSQIINANAYQIKQKLLNLYAKDLIGILSLYVFGKKKLRKCYAGLTTVSILEYSDLSLLFLLESEMWSWPTS